MSKAHCYNLLTLVKYSPDDLESVYDQLSDSGFLGLSVDKSTDIISFKSSWVPPNLFIHKLSKQFPEIFFLLEGTITERSVLRTVLKSGEYLEIDEVLKDTNNSQTVFTKYLSEVENV